MSTNWQSDREPTVWPPPPQVPVTEIVIEPLDRRWLFWQIVRRMTLMGFGRGAGFGALFGVFFFVIGAAYGVVFGALVGFVVGLVNGFLIAWLTVSRYYPLAAFGPYRRTVGMVSMGVCLLLAPIGFACLTGGMFGDSQGLWEYLSGGWGLTTTLLPSAIAILAIWMASQKLAYWYEMETLRRQKAPTLG